MSEEPWSDPDLDPTQERIRDLLASARADEPMPAHVAARLDDALAGLAAEVPTDDQRQARDERPAGRGAVVPLERRRWAPRLLAAAAAIVVLAGGTWLATSSPGGGSLDSAGGNAASDSARSGAQEGEGSSSSDREPGAASSPEKQFSGQAPASATGVPVLRPGRLAADVAAIPPSRWRGAALLSTRARDCAGPATEGGERLVVQYAGQRALLVLLPATSSHPESQRAEVWTCNGEVQVAAAMVPIRH